MHTKPEAFARNEIGQALNRILRELPEGASVALERLTVKDMRFKSRQMNRALRHFAVGVRARQTQVQSWTNAVFVSLGATSVLQSAMSHCGFTLPMNRRSRLSSTGLWCGYEAKRRPERRSGHRERFGDTELNTRPFCDVETVWRCGSCTVSRVPVVYPPG